MGVRQDRNIARKGHRPYLVNPSYPGNVIHYEGLDGAC